ncbi:hypothetical protein IUY40_18345 [Flavobacterium sp. ALJ2]|uniref:hypothetical protein n=1 Tax=Flavobacterium sp. ALJ2 TaxID=2786960 RepID=UPI0018A0E64C|nr:hypothetical protein [Flavobacterium sp. ALJ2]MBF7093496.1 hypothetical protein [Flavobacterium sp. ALJ2]
MKITEVDTKKESNNKYEPTLTLNDDKNMIKIKQKDYNLYTSSKNCQFEILVDNVPPFVGFFGKMTEDGIGFNGAVPINSCLLKSEMHNIVVKVYPRYKKTMLEYGSYFSLDAYYRKVHTIDDNLPNRFYLSDADLTFFNQKKWYLKSDEPQKNS